jgi:hypothetical protein
MTDDRAQFLREAIKRHLKIHGPREWNLIREQFPEISHATFWRHVKAVREGLPPVEEKPGPTSEPDHGLGGRLFPPFFDPLKKLTDLERVLFEVEEMGRQAKNGQGKITNWRMHAKSIEMRRSMLAEQAELAERLADLGKIQRLYDSIMEVIEGVSPDVAKEIMLRLGHLQERLAEGT